MTPLSARHWNGNQVCSIDIETTGLDPYIHEIIQIALLPLDHAFIPRTDVNPFYVNIKPECPELFDSKADAQLDYNEAGTRKHHISKSKLTEICLHGFDPEAVKEMLYTWLGQLKLPCTKWGKPKVVFPLGHNFAHDRAFLMKWLGQQNYEEFFGTIHCDTMVTAQYMNDQAAFHSNAVPFSKIDLTWLARVFRIDTVGRHDALVDAKITADVYREMCKMGVL